MFESPFAVLAALAALVALVFRLESVAALAPLFRRLPAIFWIYSLPMLATSAGLLPESSPLSVLAVEMLPELNRAPDPLGTDLGSTRILRSSRLVPVPPVCVQPPCP